MRRNDHARLDGLPNDDLSIVSLSVNDPAVNDPTILDWDRLAVDDGAILDLYRSLRLDDLNRSRRVDGCVLQRLLVGGIRPLDDSLAKQACAGCCDARNANQERKKSLRTSRTELLWMIHFILKGKRKGKRKGKETEQTAVDFQLRRAQSSATTKLK